MVYNNSMSSNGLTEFERLQAKEIAKQVVNEMNDIYITREEAKTWTIRGLAVLMAVMLALNGIEPSYIKHFVERIFP